MASNLECVGLGVADKAGFVALVNAAMDRAELLYTVDGIGVHRWQDPSGARLVLGLRGKELVDFLPSYAAEPGGLLAEVEPANDSVVTADVVDESGELMTKLALELEEHRLVGRPEKPKEGPAAFVALGVRVTVHADEEAYAASDASLLNPTAEPSEPPAHVVEAGHPWPPRMAAESFISYGAFGPPDQAQAHARLNGTVVDAKRVTNSLTGQAYIVARARTVGFEADVCLPGSEHTEIPPPGAVVAGEVFLVGSMPGLMTAGERPGGRISRFWRR